MGWTPRKDTRRRQWRVAVGDHATAHRARREFAEELRRIEWHNEDLAAAELVFGELVHNAVRHAAREVLVELLIEQRVTLRVCDDGPCFWISTGTGADTQAERGRGLIIVRAMARGLNVEPLEGGGCAVTAVLPLSASSGRAQREPERAGNGMR